MQKSYSNMIFDEYKQFRRENYDVINKYNALKTAISNSILDKEDFILQVIKGLYEDDKSIKDIASFLNMTEYDIFFIAVENNIIK